MLFSNKRGVGLPIETLVKLILLSAFLLIAVGLILMLRSGFSQDGAKKYSCWFTSSLKASDNPIKGVFPDTCAVRNIDKDLGMSDVARLLRDTWWQYGEGKADFSVTHGDILEAAKFKVSESVGVVDLMKYLLAHKKGSASSLENSDYNYLQKGAKGSTVCFDHELKDDDYKLKQGVQYHLYFADSSMLDLFKTDKLLVMKDLRPRSYWDNENSFVCYSPLTEVVSAGAVLDEVTWIGWLKGGGWVA